MKIVFVVSSLDPERGAGTAERTRRLALQLAALGCKCSIIAMAGTAWLSELNAAGIDVYLTGQLGRRFPIPLPLPIRISRLLGGADVIHVMGYWNLLAALVCFTARIRGTPFALCPAGELAPGFRNAPWKKVFYRLFGRTMIARAASIIATTAREREQIMRTEGVAPDRIVISPNGISPRSVSGTCRMQLPAGPFVLFLGRLAYIKGPDLLVDSFAMISRSAPDTRLVIAGPDCGMRAALERKVRSLKLTGRVMFLGYVNEEARHELYRRAAFLVVPSRSEVMSMVALEAAAAGIPVLLTDRCGFDEVEEVGGGLVVAADAEALAAGLMRMVGQAGNLALMGDRLREFVLQRYASTSVARQLTDHLAELAGRT